MKYKVGDKVKVRSDLKLSVLYDGLCTTEEMIEKKIVTIASIHGCYYEIEEDDYDWTDEMFEGLAEDELTAEELAKTIGNICEVHNECKECPFRDINGEDYCVIRMGKNVDKTLKIAKQWKADHEKKLIETEFIYIVRIIEDKQCVHEEEIVGESEDEACERALKKYCEDHKGKFYAVAERICVVKE